METLAASAEVVRAVTLELSTDMRSVPSSSYPISDGNHMGTFFVPVKEGILSLPYDRVEREDYEVFTLEDACLCDATSMEVFLEDWDSFSGQLRQAMGNMAWALRHLEQISEEES